MKEILSIEKLKEVKQKLKLIDYISSNVYFMGSVNYNDIYSSPTIKFLLEILYYIPDEISLDVINGCYFVFPIRDHGMYIPFSHFKDRDIIVFNSFNGMEDLQILEIMLHEIAHFYLRHKNIKTNSEYENKEKEAKAWAKNWLKLLRGYN